MATNKPFTVPSANRFFVSEPAFSVPSASYETGNLNPIPKPIAIPPPTAPTGLVSSNITSTGFQLSWTPGTGQIVDQVVIWGSFIFLVGAGTTSFIFTGLPVNTTNSAFVTAVNAGGSAVSTGLPVTTATGAPQPPTNVTASSITQTGFSCSWTAGAFATGYTATWGTFNGVVTGTTAVFTGLPTNTTHSLIVTSTNPYGSAAAPGVNVSTLPSPPPAPTGLATVNRATNRFTLTWSTALPATVYTATWGTYTGVVNGNTATFTNLPAGTTNNCIVVANNGQGSTPSAPLSVTTASPITFDTGQQVQTSGQIGFFIGPLSPGTFVVPSNFDIYNNGGTVVNNTYVTLPGTFVNFTGGFDYDPPQAAGLFAYRWASSVVPNPLGSGNPGDSWMADIACPTTGNTAEFRNLTTLNGNSVWNFKPGDTITTYLLIAYGAWIFRTQSPIDPGAFPAYWRIQFTYNPIYPT